jgi:Ca-activated chloride channel family protein
MQTFHLAGAAALAVLPIARQIISSPQQDGPATVVVRPGRALQLETLKATIRIRDAAATTDLELAFRNVNNAPAEETFLWPVPDGSSVSKFELWVDGKPQKAELLDKDKARGIYEDIVRRQRDPGLLEWAGYGCVRASVFPVPARGEGRVRLSYQTLMPASGGAFEYSLPLRMTAAAPQGVRSFVIDGSIESSRALAAIYSPSHNIDIRRSGDLAARFSFETNNTRLERDFTLAISPAEKEFGAMLLAHRDGGDGTFSLVLAPRQDLASESIQPKDVIFVVDTSGSMAGEKIEQVKKALQQCVPRLNRNDRFSIIRFSTEAEAFRGALASPTKEMLEDASRWIQKLEARGGTNIDEALASALAIASPRSVEGLPPAPPSDGRLTMIFFLTDGLPTVGTTDVQSLLSIARERNRQGLRIFTFGVGYDVNTQLLDKLAGDSRAAREYVLPGQDVEMKVSALFDKVAFPALTDVSLSFDGAEVYDVYPKQTPDLFRGAQLVVCGRYRSEGKKTVRLSGALGNARREWIYELDFPRQTQRNDSLPVLWASRKIGFLLDEIRLRGSSREIVDEVRRLGREYNIVTPYTSFLVVEEGQRLSAARGITTGGRAQLERLSEDGRKVVDELRLDSFDDDAKESLKRIGYLSGKASGEDSVRDSMNSFELASADGAEGKNTGLGSAPAAGSLVAFVRSGGNPEERGKMLARVLTRNVGNRVFHRVDNAWVDSAFTEAQQKNLVKIAFLSDEYFELLHRAPEISACLALGTRVVVGFKGTFYEITAQ